MPDALRLAVNDLTLSIAVLKHCRKKLQNATLTSKYGEALHIG